ncbi:MAG: SCO family protein [Croceibacterium sp.]
MPAPAVSRFALCLALGVLAGCGSGARQPAAPPPLAGAAIGGPFELTDKAGKTVRWSDFAGKYRIVYFGYTYCPDACPTDVARMSQGLSQFEKGEPARGAKVQPIFISVDPARDTPAKVGEFAANFHPRLIGLTGTPAQVAGAAKAFAVFYERAPGQPDGSYMVNHSTVTYLFGPKGEPLATLPTDKGPAAVAAELTRWVQ